MWGERHIIKLRGILKEKNYIKNISLNIINKLKQISYLYYYKFKDHNNNTQTYDLVKLYFFLDYLCKKTLQLKEP